jgi:uncharacterized protein (DUF1810 family)
MENRKEYNLNRFIKAQAGIYKTAVCELKNGHKTSHWMWFIFPQIKGLGFSSMSIQYSIKSLQEAEKYLDHPILGSRIRDCSRIVLNINGYSARQIFGSIDELKFRSSMTLFNYVQNNEKIFELVLVKYFKGLQDKRTLELLSNY